MLAMLLANAIGQQDLERLALELVVLVAEHALGGSVHQDDVPGGVDQQDAFGGRLEDQCGHFRQELATSLLAVVAHVASSSAPGRYIVKTSEPGRHT